MTPDLGAVLQDRNGDGVTDYLNVRFIVADFAPPEEIAAAANIAARMAFETGSLDFPLGLPVSAQDSVRTIPAIVIGRAVGAFLGEPAWAFPDAADAEEFARSLLADRYRSASARPEPLARRAPYALSALYTAQGLLADTDGDHIPDHTATRILLGPDVHDSGVIDLAARIAFECAGLRLPLACTASTETSPAGAVLVGASNPYVRRLAERGVLQPESRPGYGRIEVIAEAFDGCPAVVITGGDPAGEAAAIRHAAHRLPYAWHYGRDHLQLSTIEDRVRRFFARRSSAGQVAAAVRKGQEALAELSPHARRSSRVHIFVDGVAGDVAGVQAEFPDAAVTASTFDIQDSGPLIFEEHYPLGWEVFDARRHIRRTLLPLIRAGSAVAVELRLSEPKEIRRRFRRWLEKILIRAGADPRKLDLTVLAAHKQAYHWIDEVLKPRLANAAAIRIFFRRSEASEHLVQSPMRRLHEIYPVEEVLARDLKLDPGAIFFEALPADAPHAYEVRAEDSRGAGILEASFDPSTVERPMFDLFPDYARVQVETGWCRAAVDGAVAIDARIRTDPERFWDVYQQAVLPKVRDYILELHGGKTERAWSPHFARLDIDVRLSEPDAPIGIQEERISTLEALHEDLYFETLLFFDLVGTRHGDGPLTYPGRIVPRIRPSKPGPGRATVRLIGKSAACPRVTLHSDSAPTPRTWTLPPVDMEMPRVTAITVRHAGEEVADLDIQIDAGGEDAVEMARIAGRMVDRGSGPDWLSFEGVGRIDLVFRGRVGERVAIRRRRRDGCYAPPRLEPGAAHGSSPLVSFDEAIGPADCEAILKVLAGFPEVRVFHAGQSYLGQPVWAMDVTAPVHGKYVSQARAITAKPVLMITGRQHANEVSSTSHILKLAELLASDPAYRPLLNRVNFVLHPIANPDGAALVDELRRTTPGFMLHAGYLGSLGVDVTHQQWARDPKYPEALVRPCLWRMWLPDIVLNPHGYPSHEWVQMFGGYTAWLRSLQVAARDWWIPRGWFMPGMDHVDDPAFPDHQTAVFQLRDRIAAAIDGVFGDVNAAMYARYARYGAFEPDVYAMTLHKNVLIYTNPAVKADPDSFQFMTRHPEVTFFEAVSETPDEVAEGRWLERVAEPGLVFSLVHARYLAEAEHAIERSVCRQGSEARFRVARKRPGLLRMDRHDEQTAGAPASSEASETPGSR